MNQTTTRTALVQVTILVTAHDIYREATRLAFFASLGVTSLLAACFGGWVHPLPAFIAASIITSLLLVVLARSRNLAGRAFDLMWDGLDDEQQQRIAATLDAANQETP